MRGKKRAWKVQIALAAVCVLCLAALLILLPARRTWRAPLLADVPVTVPAETAVPAEESPLPIDPAEDAEKIVISELMPRNRAVLPDGDGDFSDWAELENISDTPVDLTGWTLSDREKGRGWSLPGRTLGPGGRLLVFLSGKDRPEDLHADFSLSGGETLYLRNRYGTLAAEVPCLQAAANVSLCRQEDGSYAESLYPTPGLPNTGRSYEEWQAAQTAPGPLVINEVVVSNLSGYYNAVLGTCDWVEIKNISDQPVELADYYLSDKPEDYQLWQFPQRTLKPGERLTVCCDDSGKQDSRVVQASFGLDSENDELFLTDSQRRVIDYAALRDIPYEGSYGRLPGENGWFYFAKPSFNGENSGGCRRVSAAPAALTADGVFEGVDAVRVELASPGAIYYSTNGSLPTQNGSEYTGPLSVTGTCVVRAVAVEEGALPSRPLTLTYILNEGHSLPVVSVATDSPQDFNNIYNNRRKGVELPASISFFEEGGSFSLNCGVRMYGERSLDLPKKNMSIHFRGAYGQSQLDYDLYGGGVTEFHSFVLRSGSDFYNTIVRNELGLNLALQFSDRLSALRSRYCVLYINGQYRGIYALEEKSNEWLYANQNGVSRDSVTVMEASISSKTELYKQVFDFCQSHNMALQENYEHLCTVLDVDSLIDWIVLEGYAANSDMTYGNLRWGCSTENGGKWRPMLYDLDATFSDPSDNFYNMFSQFWLEKRQISRCVVAPLLKNETFVDRLLTRAGEALNGPLTNENAVAELDRLAAQVAPEVARDYARFGMSEGYWQRNVERFRDFFLKNDWRQHNIDMLSTIFRLTEEEREHYFG